MHLVRNRVILNSYGPNLGGAIISSLIVYSMNNHGVCIEMAKIPMRPKILKPPNFFKIGLF